jgi:hypothetical protein
MLCNKVTSDTPWGTCIAFDILGREFCPGKSILCIYKERPAKTWHFIITIDHFLILNSPVFGSVYLLVYCKKRKKYVGVESVPLPVASTGQT